MRRVIVDFDLFFSFEKKHVLQDALNLFIDEILIQR